MTLIATFLAGSLLSLLLPVCLLIALVVWYVGFIRRVPETGEGEGATAAATAVNPAPGGAAPPETSHHPGEI